jgi:Na+/melibiose symporter-like transporter
MSFITLLPSYQKTTTKMRFFSLPKNATIKALLASAVLQAIFGMVLIELSNQAGTDWRKDYTDLFSRFTLFGGIAFLVLAVIAYWVPRAAAMTGVVLYAAFIALQVKRDVGVFLQLSIVNIPMVTLLVFALFCAFRQKTSRSLLPAVKNEERSRAD